jgi:putative copper export protein
VTFWNGVLWLHLLGMAFFVGGQLMLAGVVVPLLRGDGERMRAAARRFGIGSLIALGVLVATGVAMASHLHRWHASSLQVKMGLVVVLLGLLYVHTRRPHSHLLDGLTFGVSVAIVWLGIVVAG